MLSRPFERLPGLCAVCRRWTSGRLCEACIERHAAPVPRCERCGLQVAIASPACGRCVSRGASPVARTVVAADYDFPWDGLVTAFKFHRQLELAPALARRLHVAVDAVGEPHDALVLPVPLGPQRLRERGYNQAWELARRVARRRLQPSHANVLSRLRDTPHQTGLGEAERARNLRGAFLVEPREAQRVRGRRIALVDDVMTSGATAHEAARALLAAGAAEVRLWVLARTPAPQER